MKFIFVFCALISTKAFAGNSDFDAYLNANSKNRSLNQKARNQDAFTQTRAYQASEDPQVTAASNKGAFKMGGSTSGGGSFGGTASTSSGAGSFKPSSVTSKPVTLTPTNSTAPTQASTGSSQQSNFGTTGVTPSSSSSTSSGSTTQASVGGTTNGTSPSNCNIRIIGTVCAPSGGSDPYVSNANSMAQQQYDASQAAYQAQQAAQQAQQAAVQNVLQQTRQAVQVPVFIPR